ncbi:MAG: AMP-binding protein [Acidimicrobiales bacterium]
MTTLPARLEGGAQRGGTVTFVGSERAEAVPWAQLHEEARAMAAGLAARGLGPGSHVALLGPTTRALVTAIQAIWLAGATAVVLPLPLRLNSLAGFAAQTRTRIADADIATVVVDRDLAGMAAPEPGDPTVVLLDELVPGPGAPPPGAYDPPRVLPTDLALLQFTSGSTAEPKGVQLPHATVLANLDAVADAVHLDPATDVLVSWLPLYHDMGLLGFLTLPMITGTDLVLGPTQDFLAAPARWLQWMSTFRGTATGGPNFSYALAARALRRLDRLDLSRWRIALNGAEAVDPATVEGFVAAGAPHGLAPGAAYPAFGMAEVAIGATLPEPGRGLVVDAVDAAALGSSRRAVPAVPAVPAGPAGPGVRRLVRLGPPVGGLDLRICDQASGRSMAEREVGEVELRGTSVTPGYYNNPQATADAFRDGWLRTGDLGYLVDGELVVCGRIKDVIIVGGRNVFPEDVERAVAQVEGVRAGNVIAFGVDGRRGREGVVVVAETRADNGALGSLRRAVAASVRDAVGVATDDIVLVGPGTLPKTSSGKLQRSVCRDRYLACGY